MTARPWMPLYIGDYLADTTHLGALQSGAYIHLIMHYWQHGGLPTDDAALMRIARMTPAEWKRERPTLAAFFQDGWKHKRIDAELAHAADVSSKRRASALQKRSKSSAIAPAIAEQLDTHAGATSQSQSQQQDRPSDEKRARDRALRSEFDQFWQRWPNKVGKPAAFKAFAKARKTAPLATILFGADRYVTEKPGDRPWLNPATFLNQERFNDEPASPAAGAVDRTSRRPHDAIFRGLAKAAQARSGNGQRPPGDDGGLFDHGGTAPPDSAREGEIAGRVDPL